MLDPAIKAFFDERKEGWLKKKIKSGMSEEEKAKAEHECEAVFSLDNWLPHAAKRARQMSMSTHPCTFSHPSARKNKNGTFTSIIANAEYKADGFLRTGNSKTDTDALGNAAALDVYKFLSLVTQTGETLLEHIEQDSDLAKSLLTINSESYDALKSNFLMIAKSDESAVTSSKVKQVFFPVEDGYHQLSILSNSGLIYKLRSRIDNLRFSEKVKEGREKRRSTSYFDGGYKEIYQVTTIGYGGTKPQNISVLNNQNGGKSHLLLSVPPNLEARTKLFPTRNFFKQSIHIKTVHQELERLHKVFSIEKGGDIPLEKARKARDRCLYDILDIVLTIMIELREIAHSQFRAESSQLPEYQKVWLCPDREEERMASGSWLDTLCGEIAHWILISYKKAVKNPVALGEAEHRYIQDFIHDHREVFQ